jgi:hypothetical protein
MLCNFHDPKRGVLFIRILEAILAILAKFGQVNEHKERLTHCWNCAAIKDFRGIDYINFLTQRQRGIKKGKAHSRNCLL